MLQADNVSLTLHKRSVIDGISLSVAPGELVAICGPNGAGKSSLMRLLSGELSPTHGMVSWQGMPLPKWGMLALARQRAMLQQRCEVGFDYSVMEVVLLARHPHHHGAARDVDIQVANAALAELDASHLAGRGYATLSGGEQSRVQMARVLAQIWEPTSMPRLLLLDEPTAALDPRQQHRLLAIARAWANQGDIAVIAIVHDLNLAALYADRIALLKDGKLQTLDTAEAVLTPETIEACFELPCVSLAYPGGGIPVIAAKRSAIVMASK